MPDYELELLTRFSEPVAPLPKAQLTSVKWELNTAGSLSFEMKQDDPDVMKPLCVEHEVRCTVEGVEDPWQGPIWQDVQSPKTVSFDAEGVASYMTRRYIDFSSLWFDDLDAGYDQFQIAWGLVQYAQGMPVAQAGSVVIPAKNFNVDAGDLTPSGRLRLRRYLRNEHAEILPLLQEFAGLRNFDTGEPDGFDFDIITKADGARLFQPYFPQKGSLRLDLALEYGRNLSTYTVREDGKEIATNTYATGQSNGDVKLEAHYEDAAASAQYSQMTSFIDYSDQSDEDALREFARRHTESHKRPQVVPELTAVQVPVTLLGNIQTGDRVPIHIVNGRTNLNDVFRIGSITWKPRPNTLELGILPKVDET